MNSTEEQLRSKLNDCDTVDEHAALLTELAQLTLSKGNAEEAQALFQQAFDVRLRDPVVAASAAEAAHNHSPTAQGSKSASQHQSAATSAQPASISGVSAAALASERSNTSAVGDWEKSDDWEPDLTILRKASSLQREAAAAAAAASTANGHVEPGEAGPPQSSTLPWRSGGSAAGRPGSSSGRSASGGSRTPGTTTPLRPRGRGESRIGATSDSDTEWESILGVPNQPHIVEFHGLNRGVKTQHLEDFLLEYIWGDTTANIKWVDDEHALAVFPCAEAAQQLLDSKPTKFKVRPYCKASGGALQISAEELTPPRSARPKTTTAVARRLISNALGNREVRDRAAERELADLRKANKQVKQQRQQEMESVWGDDE